MKHIFMTLFLALLAFPAFAQDGTLKTVEAQYVCMVNNTVFDKPQIAVEVDGKTYYGCCPMCKERLAKDASARMAIDPVSAKEVDKASAIIGSSVDGKVYYFENEANLRQFKPSDTHQEHNHETGEGHGTQ